MANLLVELIRNAKKVLVLWYKPMVEVTKRWIIRKYAIIEMIFKNWILVKIKGFKYPSKKKKKAKKTLKSITKVFS